MKFISNKPWLPYLLFFLTVITTIMSGTQWLGKDATEISNWHYGITYSLLILSFLLAHEFGHYFASRIHKVNASLPYCIPALPIPEFLFFGTFGAVIKTRSPIPSKKALFDIGAAGPIAGLIVALIFLIYGLQTLPPKEYIYQIHPYYLTMYNGQIPDTNLFFGDNILFSMLAKLFASKDGWLPPMNEIYHYPFLNVGWFGLFVSSLNLLPLGQLDGGHITYAMFGNKQIIIARIVWIALIILGIGGLLSFIHDFLIVDYQQSGSSWLYDILFLPLHTFKAAVPIYFESWGGWLFWAVITKFFIKLKHPKIGHPMEKLDKKRIFLGWATLIIFILSFSFNGIYLKL